MALWRHHGCCHCLSCFLFISTLLIQSSEKLVRSFSLYCWVLVLDFLYKFGMFSQHYNTENMTIRRDYNFSISIWLIFVDKSVRDAFAHTIDIWSFRTMSQNKCTFKTENLITSSLYSNGIQIIPSIKKSFRRRTQNEWKIEYLFKNVVLGKNKKLKLLAARSIWSRKLWSFHIMQCHAYKV